MTLGMCGAGSDFRESAWLAYSSIGQAGFP